MESTRDFPQHIEIAAGLTVRSSYACAVNDIGQRTAVTPGGSAFTGSPADWSWGSNALGNRPSSATAASTICPCADDTPPRLASRRVGVPPTSTTRCLYDRWDRITEYLDATGDVAAHFEYDPNV